MTERAAPSHRGFLSAPFFVLLARFIALVANAGVVLVLARYFGPEDFGRYAHIQGYATILATLAMGGISIILVREIAAHPSDIRTRIGTGLGLQAVIVLLVYGSGLTLAYLIYDDGTILRGILIVVISHLFFVPASLLSAAFVATQHTAYMSAAVLLERVSFIGVMIAMLMAESTLSQILWAQSISAAAQLIFALWVTATKLARFPWPMRFHLGKQFARASLPLSVSEGLRSLDQQLGVILLELLHSSAAAGLFGAPQRLIVRLTILPESVLRGFLPLLSRSDVQQGQRFGELGGMFLRYAGIVALLIAAVVSPMGQPLSSILFGDAYTVAGPVVSVLACVTVPMFVGYVLRYLLAAIGRQNIEVLGLVVGVLVNGLLAALTMPRWGALGAAAALLVSQTIFCAIGLFTLRFFRPLDLQPKLWLRAAPIVVGLALVTAWASHSTWWPLLVGCALVAAIALLIVSKVFNLADLELLVAASDGRGP